MMAIQDDSYQEVYQRLLANSELLPLSKFKTSKVGTLLYPDAHKYPQFFKNNLLSPGRVIKLVRGKSALLRAFYYQLMKLTFEIEVNEVDYVEVFKSVVFHPSLLLEDADMQSPSSGRTYTDKQYKRILAEFVELMAQQSIPNFEFTVMEYPIIDEALTKTFEALVARCYRGPNHIEQMLQWLSRTFSLGIERHGRCYKFEQSDIFLYEESDQEYYMAFLNEMAEVSDYSESAYHPQERRSIEERKSRTDRDFKSSLPEMKLREESEDYPLASDRYRYSAQIPHRKSEEHSTFRRTIDNKSFIRDLSCDIQSLQTDKPSEKHSKIGSLLDIMSDRSSKDLQQPSKTLQQQYSSRFSQQSNGGKKELYNSQHSDQMTPQFQTNAYLHLEDNYNPFNKKYSEKYISNLYEKNQKFDYVSQKQQHKFTDYQYDQPLQDSQTLGYKQEQNMSYQHSYAYGSNTSANNDNYYSNFAYSKNNMLADSQERQKNPFEEEELFYKPKSKGNKPTVTISEARSQPMSKEDDSRGTLYRQFTDTKVLEAMTSFQRMKVNNLRKKYKGMHRRDLRNLC